MGFFKDLKEDFSQAMNDLMPEEDLNMEDYQVDIQEEFIDKGLMEKDDSETEQKDEDDETSENPTKDKRDIQDILEEEVFAAIEALNTKEEVIEEDKVVEIVKEEEILEDGLTEEELIQRMIDEDERIKKEQEAKEQEKREQQLKEQEQREDKMEEPKMAEHVEKTEMEADDAKDMELIAQLLGEDNNEDTDIDEEILAKSDEEEETKEEEYNVAIDENRERGNDVTVITKGTKINGSISSDGSLEIMGTINGDIDCLGKLSIIGNVTGNSQAAEIYVNTARLDGGLVSSGSVKVGVGTIVVGDVKASSAVIAGAVKGEVDVNGPVVIDSTAIVKGNINAKSVQINNGAVVDGYCSLTYASVDIDNFFDGEK